MAAFTTTTTTAAAAATTTATDAENALEDFIDITDTGALIVLSALVFMCIIAALTLLPWARWKKDVGRVACRVADAVRHADMHLHQWNQPAARATAPVPTATTANNKPAPMPMGARRGETWVELEEGLPTPPPAYSAF